MFFIMKNVRWNGNEALAVTALISHASADTFNIELGPFSSALLVARYLLNLEHAVL